MHITTAINALHASLHQSATVNESATLNESATWNECATWKECFLNECVTWNEYGMPHALNTHNQGKKVKEAGGIILHGPIKLQPHNEEVCFPLGV